MSDGRLRWQCRRGMKELDALLVRYLDEVYDESSAEYKSAFESLLSLSDPELIGYLLKGERSESDITNVIIDRILGRTSAGPGR